MKIDIKLIESGRGVWREMRFPLLPEEFHFSGGGATFITTDIMGRGEVLTPSGSEVDTYSWESEFPGELRKNDPMLRGEWKKPDSYVSRLNYWKNAGVKLTLIITGYSVYDDVYIKEFTPKVTGAYGDVHYEITLVEAREITITTTKVKASEVPKRQAYSPKTYKVVKGDDLWSIAERFYATPGKWTTIYNANKQIIEQTAKKHGFKSSDNGHWIFPGTVLTLP